MQRKNHILRADNIYGKKHPAYSIAKIAINFVIYNWGFSIVAILFLIFGSEFAKLYIMKHNSNTVTSSEIVTSLGLSFLLNTIIYVFIFGIASSSSTFYIRRIGAKKHSTHKEWFGSLMILVIFSVIIISVLVAFLGKYVVFLQNNHLPKNYINVITSIMYMFALSVPFIAVYVIYTSHLTSEGNTWVFSVSGISLVVFFIAYSWMLYEGNAFGFIHEADVHISYILGFSYVLAFCSSAIILIITNYFVHKFYGSFFSFSVFNIKHFKVSHILKILNNALPIFSRTFVVVLSTIIINMFLNYVYIPPGSYESANKLPNNSLYWQYLTSVMATILTFLMRGMWAFSGASRYIYAYNHINKNYKQMLLTFKWSFIYVFIYLVVTEIIIISAAPFLLHLFGIDDNVAYTFIGNNGHIGIFVSRKLFSQAVMVIRIFFASSMLLSVQPVLTSFSLATKRIKLSYFLFSLDRLICEVPLFIIFAILSTKFKLYYLAWVSYLISDSLSFIIIGGFLIFYIKMVYSKYLKSQKLNLNKT